MMYLLTSDNAFLSMNIVLKSIFIIGCIGLLVVFFMFSSDDSDQNEKNIKN